MRKLAMLFACGVVMGGCVSDPNDPATWIKKLDDPREQKEAIRMLVKLKDKQAVAPLIALYKHNHDPELLKQIGTFDDPASVPIMIDAVSDYSEDSYEAASFAATSLGGLGDKSAVDALVKAVLKPLPIKTRANVVKLEAMKSLARLKDPRAVDLLIKVVSTSADDQDFFLNKVAAKSLVDFADPKAAPALVRGLFMVGRGANIFQECRTALLAIGEPAVGPLVDAMQRKNAELEADAKKYQFVPGIIVQKTAMVLGDLRSRKAVPALVAELSKEDEGIKAGEGKGVSGHREVLSALGRIGDPSVLKTLETYAGDAKKPKPERLGAFDGLWQLGDAAGAPTLLAAAKVPFIKNNEIDPAAGELAMVAATAYSRLVGPGGVMGIQKIPEEIEDAAAVFKAADARVALATACKSDAACYEKELDKTGPIESAKAEKGALMLTYMGKPGLPGLVKHIGAPDASARNAILFGVARLANASSTDARAALDKQIEIDEQKPPLLPLVHEMRAVRALLSH